VEQQRVDGRRGARRAERLALWRQPVVVRDEVRTERYQRGALVAASGGVEGCLAMTRLLLLCALMGREGNQRNDRRRGYDARCRGSVQPLTYAVLVCPNRFKPLINAGYRYRLKYVILLHVDTGRRADRTTPDDMLYPIFLRVFPSKLDAEQIGGRAGRVLSGTRAHGERKYNKNGRPGERATWQPRAASVGCVRARSARLAHSSPTASP
jgi:hypothetical protein